MAQKNKHKYEEITSGRHIKGGKPMNKWSVINSKPITVVILLVVFIAIGGLGGVFLGIIDTTKDITADDLKYKDLTTIFYDKDGKEFGSIYSSQNRMVVGLNEMSKFLPKAFVAIEDERFYKHKGIDFRRIAGAVINYVIPGGKSYGASTITQQLVKNLTGEKQVTLKRKLQEQWRAIDLETKMSKDQILELYLNTIYLGEGVCGVEAAAVTYFDKEAKDLTLAESAMIAGITQNPSKYDPIKSYENSKNRQEIILDKMVELGDITQEECEKAKREKIKIKKGTIKKVLRQSYFIDNVCEDVLRDLQVKKNLSKEIAQKLLFSAGLKIYTTADSKVQSALDEAYADDSSVFRAFSGSSVKPQSAMVVIDYRTGKIVGMVGGRGEKSGIMTFNRATDAKRQPGSSIKPIAVYGPALDDGLITAGTVIDDVPIKIGDWSPRNWYKDGFWGLSTIRRGIQNSMNIVAVKVWLKLGSERSAEFLNKVGITSLTDADMNPASLALGGLTKGVSPLEMAAAYGAIANGGHYIKPITYTKVEDRNGKVLLENRPESSPVMDERAAYILTNMMEDVVNSGTAKAAQLSNMPVAGKTGTTSKNMDRWFVGYTPYYVAATWFGYDKQKNIPGDTNYSAKLWKIVMEKVHSGLNRAEFVEPAGIVKKEICIDSGKLPTDLCRRDPRGNRTRVELFIKGTEPTETCKTHVEVCSQTGLLANPTCPSKRVAIVRQEPYVPADSDAPMPQDKKYEAASREYCNIH